MKRWHWFTLLLTLLTASPGSFAAGLIVVDPSTWPVPGPRPPVVPPPFRPVPLPHPMPPPIRHHAFAPLELAFHKTGVSIRDQVASVEIEQEFYNPNPRRIEGSFLFPVPKGAQIKKFAMEIEGKLVEAELLSADKARQIYEDIVRRMRDPALMEFAGRDLIRVRIFPMEPHSRKRVTLSYTQLLRADSGLVEFIYPLNTDKFSSKPIPTVSLKIDVETKHPLKTVYSPSHRVEIKRHGSNRATLSYESKEVRADADFQLFFAQETGDVGINLLTYKSGADDGYFLMLASPGVDFGDQRTVPKDVALVLDTSGSMAGKKLGQARKALQFCLENLNDEDRFEVVRFSTEVELLFGRLSEASKQNREKASEFVKALKPIGGTAIDAALKSALALRAGEADRPFVVIFLTDGLPTVGVTNEDQIVAGVNQNAANARVFCFGIGHDVNTRLLDLITEKTRAASQYVLPEEDIEVKVSNFFTKIREPVLANLKITFPANVRAAKLYPTALPDLFKGEQLVVAGRYSGDGRGAVVIEGSAQGARKKFAEDVRFPESAGEYDFIPRLWATRRVGYLLDEIRLHGENRELRDEVTELARQFGIVTPYTAYLIVEDEKQRGVPLTSQSLPQLQMDPAAREMSGTALQDLYRRRSGGAAVAGARYGLALKSADSAADALAAGNLEANRAFAFSAPGIPGSVDTPTLAGRPSLGQLAAPSVVSRVAGYTQQSRFVNGRHFFQNGGQWIDSAAQKMTNAPRVRIQFNSIEYFALATRQSDALPWLALGQNLQFVLDGRVYEIFE